MARYYCFQCDQHKDTDASVPTEGPDGELWCEQCLIQYEEDMAAWSIDGPIMGEETQ